MVGPHEIITPEGIPKLVCAGWVGKRRGKVRNESDAHISTAKFMGKEMTEGIRVPQQTSGKAKMDTHRIGWEELLLIKRDTLTGF